MGASKTEREGERGECRVSRGTVVEQRPLDLI